MALLETTTILKNYVTVRSDFNIADLIPFKRQAIRDYIKPFVGELAIELADTATGTDAEIKNSARELLEESVACFALYLGTPELALQFGGGGVSVADTTDFKQATTFQKNEFQRNLLRRGHTALDALLLLLEANKDKFTSYTAEFQDKYSELLVPSASLFNTYYNIMNSRQTYLAMQPTMRRVEDEFLGWLCGDFITAIKTTGQTEFRLQVKTLLQKAVVALTVSKVVMEGQFILDEKGIHLKFDTLEYEKTVTNINLKINDFLLRTSKEQETAGMEYLKAAQRVILANIDAFTECDGAVIIPIDPAIETGATITTSVNKRIVAL